ncbi:MAG TPA: hypothetical protein VHD56_10920 [Tepidisphaeraceae bacterium]|nr:hypothetical protein [Tepidisphaeraceae bacterium]
MLDDHPKNEAQLAYEIELGLQRVARAPDDLTLHQQLRETAMNYAARGFRTASLLEQVKLPPPDSLQHLLHVERIWSLDARNLTLIPKLLAALAAVERSNPQRDFSGVRRWL